MGAIVGMLRAFFRNAGPYLAGWFTQAVVALGLSVAITNVAVEPLVDLISQNMQGGPPVILQVLGMLGADQFITMVLTAFAAKAAGNAVIRKRRTP